MERWITDWEPSTKFPMYTRANAGEILPQPASPACFEYVWQGAVAHGWADGCERWGSFSPDETDNERPEYIGSFGGYAYVNMSMIRLVGVRSPGMTAEAMDAAFLGEHPDATPYVAQPGDENPELSGKIEATMATLMGATEEPAELMADRNRMLEIRDARPDLASASDADLLERVRSMRPVIRDFFERYYIYGTASSLGPGVLGELLTEVDPSLIGRLISGVGDIDSVPPTNDMWDLGRTVAASPALAAEFDAGVDGLLDRLAGSDDGKAFLADLAAFQEAHGARGPGEWDPANLSWGVDPKPVLVAVERMRLTDDSLAPRVRAAAAVADRNKAEAAAREALAGREEGLATLDLALRLVSLYVPTRERTKLTSMMAIHEVRLPLVELGRRMADKGALSDPNHIFLLLDTEFDGFLADPGSFTAKLDERSVQFASLADLQEPFIVNGEVPPVSEWPARGAATTPVTVGEVLTGVPGSPGSVTGRARVVNDPYDARGLAEGDVLVAPLTDPAWTPLFVSTSAVVVEVGAPLSHAVIVSRELGVPCVTGVLEAATRIPDGALISVDGATGAVTILELPN